MAAENPRHASCRRPAVGLRPGSASGSVSSPAVPLFLCHANCCRSVLACYLYQHLYSGASAVSAGLVAGERISDRALAMLAWWGIDASEHQPRKVDRRLCDRAGAIFVMAPACQRRLLLESGADLASEAYLYADPFCCPESLTGGEYTVPDPSFEERSTRVLVGEFAWMRRRTLESREGLLGRGRPLIAAASCLHLLESVDPLGH
jgi:protein-tyrosine-phosphatase